MGLGTKTIEVTEDGQFVIVDRFVNEERTCLSRKKSLELAERLLKSHGIAIPDDRGTDQ